MADTTSTAPQLSFRPLARNDLSRLHAWLGQPHVAEWWGSPPTLAEIEEDYLPILDSASTIRGYIAVFNGRPAGFIQSYVVFRSAGGWWEQETDPGARGIDQFIGEPDLVGHGLGTSMVTAFVDWLFQDPAVTKVQTDPSPGNIRAIRCYRRAGFVSTGEIVTPDGPALLMVRRRQEGKFRVFD